ncbi:hypothetical protein Nepgr_011286 [Nepenthes gracilis]|uniref:Uncharacterized protein n=1 Tax=Nepenthes gracilis TaxID=150966 RepID=A0AAD3SEY0_NEPGR|nr:hypothetical protein Nepgr_011286 [Nepenthes gracilis]
MAMDPIFDSINAVANRLTNSTNFLRFLALIMQEELPTPELAQDDAVEKGLSQPLLLSFNGTLLTPPVKIWSINFNKLGIVAFAINIWLAIFLTCLGLTVLPVNILVGSYINNMFQERLILLVSEIMVCIGILLNFHIIITYTVP